MEIFLDRRIEQGELPVLVNGDDILFPTNGDLYDIWSIIIKSVGFEKSLGKNYVSKDYLFINSQPFRAYVDFQKKEVNFKFLPFFNVGLLTGQSKVTGREDAKSASFSSCYNECLRGSQFPLRTFKRFIHYNRKGLEIESGLSFETKKPGLYNFFLPRCYGGLQMTLPEGVPLKTTKTQDFFVNIGYTFLRDPTLVQIRDSKFFSTKRTIGGGPLSMKEDLSRYKYGLLSLKPKIGPQIGELLVSDATILKNLRYQPELTVEVTSINAAKLASKMKFFGKKHPHVGVFRGRVSMGFLMRHLEDSAVLTRVRLENQS